MAAAPPAPLGTILLLAVAGGSYVVMLSELVKLPHTDPEGSAFASAFFDLFGLLLWITLAILVALGAIWGRLPRIAGVAAIVLLPVSAGGALKAADLYDQQGGWPILVPALLPLLIAAYALWARLPVLNARLPPLLTSLAVGGAIIALTILPIAVKILSTHV
jgi:hypothetical protein